MIGRFQHLGIQQRIMLYAVVGLAMMFGSLGFLGLRSIQQATELVYEERLSTAYTIAGVLERDFLHVARDVQAESEQLLTTDGEWLAAHRLLEHLGQTDPFPFFQVTGVWIFDTEGRLLAESGSPGVASARDVDALLSPAHGMSDGDFFVSTAPGGPLGEIPFATVVTRVAQPQGSRSRLVAVHSISVNSSAFYEPTVFQNGRTPASQGRGEYSRSKYHLEVVDSEGLAVLGIGQDEHPGAPSVHFPVIRGLMGERRAATLLHDPALAEGFDLHVMAVVPVGRSSFYLILEQPADVALALPVQLRYGLMLLATVAFLVTLLVAWITTRHVVKPTEQLTAAAQRMARGDLESPVDISAQDEVGQLAESLDAMRRKLRMAHQQLAEANRELESQVKDRTARLAEVLRELISAQEEERYRLARELHDETAQTLGALCISLDRARDSLEDALPGSMERIQEAKAIATRLIEDTRRLILDLRPMVLDDLGLAPAIRWYAETHLEELGVTATVEVDQPAARLPKHVEVSLFRVIQEAVNNIAKHARAKHAHIRLAFQDGVAGVLVSDDGKGFDAERLLAAGAAAGSVGLIGMQERVRLLNGQIRIHSQEGGGTQISVEIPTAEQAA